MHPVLPTGIGVLVGLMIGVVLVTHGRLADELKAATEHVVGPQTAFRTVCIGPQDDMEARREEILSAIKSVDSGQGVILLTDMFGGTPSNLAISALESGRIEVIAGVNLPMLIKLASVRSTAKMQEAVDKSQEAVRKYIRVASKELTGG